MQIKLRSRGQIKRGKLKPDKTPRTFLLSHTHTPSQSKARTTIIHTLKTQMYSNLSSHANVSNVNILTSGSTATTNCNGHLLTVGAQRHHHLQQTAPHTIAVQNLLHDDLSSSSDEEVSGPFSISNLSIVDDDFSNHSHDQFQGYENDILSVDDSISGNPIKQQRNGNDRARTLIFDAPMGVSSLSYVSFGKLCVEVFFHYEIGCKKIMQRKLFFFN